MGDGRMVRKLWNAYRLTPESIRMAFELMAKGCSGLARSKANRDVDVGHMGSAAISDAGRENLYRRGLSVHPEGVSRTGGSRRGRGNRTATTA